MSVSKATREQIRSQFDSCHFDEVVRSLERYGAKEDHRDVDTIHAAILQLSGDSVQKVEDLVSAALTDYRDVLYWLTFDENGNPPPLPSRNG